MVQIDVGVSCGVDKLTRLQVANLGYHHGEKSVGCDVKRNPEESVRTALIKLAALGFTGKIALCWIAGSVQLLYVAQFFQLIAFALIMPAMVYFINEIMSPGEAVKGQALYTMMFTFATIIASFLGGWMLDAYGARMLTLVSTLVTAAGAAVIIFSIDKVEDHKRLPQD